MSILRFLLSLATNLTLAALLTAGGDPSLEQRLEKLAESLEAAREDAHVPGMSIAIVKDDEVVWARGFGLADVDAERPADESTIYAIGSTTKAFTATLVGMLVDEGKVTWDDPVTRYLPYFDLQVRSDEDGAECTLRDLLSHRHGFARMGILWFRSGLSREEVLRTAAGAEPWDDFRAGFHYCNVAYLGAGEAAGVAAGASWDEMMAERIFEPLGMTSSTVSTAEARKDPRLALGYSWDEVDSKIEHEEMVDLDAIGPAGSVNSNVVDMAQWLRLQLGRGEVDGKRLISAEQLLETWSPQIEIEADVSYGMGWMLREHDGKKLIEHGGNIDGFSAQVAFMPEESLGYVLLTNLDLSPLQQASVPLVFDALLEEWPDEAVAAEPGVLDLEDYTGIYVANFATFRDEKFEVLVKGDKLAIDVPSQRTYDLELPDAEGKWVFSLTDRIAVSFERDDSGDVVALTMHQAGFHFEVPREGVEIQPEVPVEELEKYTGVYKLADGEKRLELSIERGRLVMHDKGKVMAFETPDADGRAAFRASADYYATFSTDAEGNVDSFVFHGDKGDRLFTRLADGKEGELPTLDEVLALRGTEARVAALEAAGGTRATGEVWIAQAGVRGKVTAYARGSDRYARLMDLGKFGRMDVAVRGEEAWSCDLRGFDVLKGDSLTQAILQNPRAVTGDWSAYFDSVEVVRNDTVNDRPVHVVRLKKGDLPSRTYWVDAESGDVLRVNQTSVERSMRIPVTIDYSDFVEVDGVRRARRVEIENPMSGRTVLTFEKFESGLELDDALFTLEVAAQKNR